jgi:nitrogen fixation protein FixH
MYAATYRMVLAIALLCLSACAGRPGISGRGEQQSVDGLTITLRATDTPKLLESQEFLITLTDAQGKAVDGALVYLDLDMPTDSMGTNQPLADGLGNGSYRATTVYTMSGEWLVTVVARVEGKEYRAIFKRLV